MYNLLIALGVTVGVFGAIFALGFGYIAAIIPATIAFFVANILLAKRIGNKIQVLASAAQKEIEAQRVEKGIKLLEEGFRYGKWQVMVEPELHANIGILHYVRKEFDKARPHLEKSSKKGPSASRAKAMLGCLAFRNKDDKGMTDYFEQAVKAGKKEGLIWATYAWCLDKQGKKDEALKVLVRGVETNPTDEKLKSSMVALQNEKRLKMKAFSPEWYQFHLERPPTNLGPTGGRRVVYQRR